MITLEKLYNAAQETVFSEPRNWTGFATAFQDIFHSHMVLYTIAFEADGQTPSSFDVVSTSNPEVLALYLKMEMYKHHPVKEPDMPALEPARRSDVVSDEDYHNLGEISDFLIAHGVFYQMVVPAFLSEGRFLGLYVWRSQEQGDFDDMEKLRLALFMRHLMVSLDSRDFEHQQPENDMVLFGRKYDLTPTEIEILSYLLEGYSLKKLAEETERTYGTVRWHIRNILEKCQVNSQKDLLREFYALIKR